MSLAGTQSALPLCPGPSIRRLPAIRLVGLPAFCLVGLTADLSWTAGVGATSHDVYFGTTNPPPFQLNQTGTTFDTGTMNTNTTYYWRIDEHNAGGTTTGTVWSFTTQPPAPVTYYPSSYTVVAGSYISGNISSLTSNDNSYLVIQSQTSGSTRYARTDFTVTGIAAGTPSRIDLQVISKSNSSSTTQKVYLYNFTTSAWDQKDSTTISTSEVTRNIAITSGASNYISGGQLKIRTEGYKTNSTTIQLSHEVVSAKVTW